MASDQAGAMTGTVVNLTPRIVFVRRVTTMSSVCGVFPFSATPS
jgi:hypothetical protein